MFRMQPRRICLRQNTPQSLTTPLRVSSSGATKQALDSVNRAASIARCHGSSQQEEDEDNSTDDDGLALGGVVGTVFGPGTVGLAGVLLNLIATELVVDETNKGNGITEELGKGDRSLPDHHRRNDQEDILQNTTEGHDEGGGLSDL